MFDCSVVVSLLQKQQNNIDKHFALKPNHQNYGCDETKIKWLQVYAINKYMDFTHL